MQQRNFKFFFGAWSNIQYTWPGQRTQCLWDRTPASESWLLSSPTASDILNKNFFRTKVRRTNLKIPLHSLIFCILFLAEYSKFLLFCCWKQFGFWLTGNYMSWVKLVAQNTEVNYILGTCALSSRFKDVLSDHPSVRIELRLYSWVPFLPLPFKYWRQKTRLPSS